MMNGMKTYAAWCSICKVEVSYQAIFSGGGTKFYLTQDGRTIPKAPGHCLVGHSQKEVQDAWNSNL